MKLIEFPLVTLSACVVGHGLDIGHTTTVETVPKRLVFGIPRRAEESASASPDGLDATALRPGNPCWQTTCRCPTRSRGVSVGPWPEDLHAQALKDDTAVPRTLHQRVERGVKDCAADVEADPNVLRHCGVCAPRLERGRTACSSARFVNKLTLSTPSS